MPAISERKGIMLALLTALVSGFAIFLNKFAVTGLDASAFALAKNVVVAAFLCALILAFREFRSLPQLTRRNWLSLAAIGFIGGSLPFLLFFNALQFATAQNAAFLHKTLFIWAALFALFFLRERLDRRFIAGAALLLASTFLLFKIDLFAFGLPELMILAATSMWALENVYAKRIMAVHTHITPRMVAFGRMGFGALFMLPFLLATNSATQLLALSFENIFWIALASVLLLMYVSFWYPALKHARVSVAASVLMLGLPITSLLNAAFSSVAITPTQVLGMLLLLAGILTITGFSYLYTTLRSRIAISKSGAPQWRS